MRVVGAHEKMESSQTPLSVEVFGKHTRHSLPNHFTGIFLEELPSRHRFEASGVATVTLVCLSQCTVSIEFDMFTIDDHNIVSMVV